MLHRRFVVRGGLAVLGTSSVYGPIAAFGQNKPLVKVRYNEVVRSVLYAPAYAAITKGYFKDAGLDVELDDRRRRRQDHGGAALRQRRYRAGRP